MLYLRDDIKKEIDPHSDPFNKIITWQGKTYRHVKNRRTFSVFIGEKTYFIKVHLGIGWKEILKNILSFKKPILGAQNEWLAIQKCRELGIPTMTIAGYGKRGVSPAAQKSFLITDALNNVITLEDFAPQNLQQKDDVTNNLKKKIITQVAKITKLLHGESITHHDMYICHFMLDTSLDYQKEVKLYLIDLHRAQYHTFLRKRFIIKDLAAIYFSSMDLPLSKEDIDLFLQQYSGKSFTQMSKHEKKFWLQVKKRATTLYYKIHKRLPQENNNETNI